MANLFGNALYYGDNLEVMRAHLYDDSVDLVYLDPPFNSNRSYNLLFKNVSGEAGSAQIHAFDDTWHWSPEAERAYFEIEHGPSAKLTHMVRALRQMMGPSDMLAYLVMMAPRLVELHRVLKPTGSLYLHCDPTASHYLKLLLDTIFLPTSFRNEIVWKRATTVKGNFGQGARGFGPSTDTLLFYTKSREYSFNQPFKEYSQKYIDSAYRYVEEGTGRRFRLVSMIGPGGAAKGNPYYEVMGVSRYWRYSQDKMQALIDAGLVVQSGAGRVPNRKYYLDEGRGVPVQSLWDDIPNLQAASAEALGYPTQKPVALLERIISASSNPGDVVLDPFCGCGTAVDAAQRLGRTWIGIDISYLAIEVIDQRMRKEHGNSVAYEILGIPVDVEGAQALANRDKVEFEIWAVSLVKGQHNPQRSGDRGVDGFASFALGAGLGNGTIVISVKGGANNPGFVRDLIGTVNGHHAEMGLMITLRPPTKGMKETAATAGWFEHPNGQRYPRVQILSVEQLLHDERPNWPPMISTSGHVTRPAAAAPRRRAQAG